ncbi:MAG: Na+ dependent nucleoside transporter, partial [Aequorivita sp.]|nr:Na+ dependent nucleoside transporter [Aequorivita sp.]
MQKFTLVAIVLFFFGNTFAQSIEKTWQFSEVKDENGLSLLNINPEKDFLKLDNGLFEYQVASDSLVSKGDYMFQNNLLVLFFNKPADSIRRFRVEQVTDSSLTLSENNYKYQLKTPGLQNVSALETVAKTSEIIPSQGFSFQSLWRGVLGMVSLLIIAFLFSSNRRAINWKTVGIGLAFQLLIAIGVLKVDFIKSGFEGVGQLFVNVLDYTKAGSEFLFGGMLDINSFGFIFAFQVLPTIIFFSALTSVLFYFGIIQVVVKGMGWLLTKLLNISGAESLSVAGNIFLGQTEAPLLIKAYLEKMNKSEMLLVMIGGMATVAGAVLAAYIGFLGGDDPELRLTFAKHLLAASVMAAPGAIVISKILYPQTEPINTDVKVSSEKIGSNFLDAIANGTTEGLRL